MKDFRSQVGANNHLKTFTFYARCLDVFALSTVQPPSPQSNEQLMLSALLLLRLSLLICQPTSGRRQISEDKRC